MTLLEQERNMDIVIKVYKLDRRLKSGEKLIIKETYTGITESDSRDKIEAWYSSYPEPKYRIEHHPATKIVKNLLSGKDIEIAYDTPRCCDPSSELYWSC